MWFMKHDTHYFYLAIKKIKKTIPNNRTVATSQLNNHNFSPHHKLIHDSERRQSVNGLGPKHARIQPYISNPVMETLEQTVKSERIMLDFPRHNWLEEKIKTLQRMSTSSDSTSESNENSSPTLRFEDSKSSLQNAESRRSTEQTPSTEKQLPDKRSLDDRSEPKRPLDFGSEPTRFLDVGLDPKRTLDVGSESKLSLDVESEPMLSVDVGSEPKLSVDVGSEPKLTVDVESESMLSVDVGSEPKLSVDVGSESKLPDVGSEPMLSLDAASDHYIEGMPLQNENVPEKINQIKPTSDEGTKPSENVEDMAEDGLLETTEEPGDDRLVIDEDQLKEVVHEDKNLTFSEKTSMDTALITSANPLNLCLRVNGEDVSIINASLEEPKNLPIPNTLLTVEQQPPNRVIKVSQPCGITNNTDRVTGIKHRMSDDNVTLCLNAGIRNDKTDDSLGVSFMVDNNVGDTNYGEALETVNVRIHDETANSNPRDARDISNIHQGTTITNLYQGNLHTTEGQFSEGENNVLLREGGNNSIILERGDNSILREGEGLTDMEEKGDNTIINKWIDDSVLREKGGDTAVFRERAPKLPHSIKNKDTLNKRTRAADHSSDICSPDCHEHDIQIEFVNRLKEVAFLDLLVNRKKREHEMLVMLKNKKSKVIENMKRKHQHLSSHFPQVNGSVRQCTDVPQRSLSDSVITNYWNRQEGTIHPKQTTGVDDVFSIQDNEIVPKQLKLGPELVPLNLTLNPGRKRALSTVERRRPLVALIKEALSERVQNAGKKLYPTLHKAPSPAHQAKIDIIALPDDTPRSELTQSPYNKRKLPILEPPGRVSTAPRTNLSAAHTQEPFQTAGRLIVPAKKTQRTFQTSGCQVVPANQPQRPYQTAGCPVVPANQPQRPYQTAGCPVIPANQPQRPYPTAGCPVVPANQSHRPFQTVGCPVVPANPQSPNPFQTASCLALIANQQPLKPFQTSDYRVDPGNQQIHFPIKHNMQNGYAPSINNCGNFYSFQNDNSAPNRKRVIDEWTNLAQQSPPILPTQVSFTKPRVPSDKASFECYKSLPSMGITKKGDLNSDMKWQNTMSVRPTKEQPCRFRTPQGVNASIPRNSGIRHPTGNVSDSPVYCVPPHQNSLPGVNMYHTSMLSQATHSPPGSYNGSQTRQCPSVGDQSIFNQPNNRMYQYSTNRTETLSRSAGTNKDLPQAVYSERTIQRPHQMQPHSSTKGGYYKPYPTVNPYPLLNTSATSMADGGTEMRISDQESYRPGWMQQDSVQYRRHIVNQMMPGYPFMTELVAAPNNLQTRAQLDNIVNTSRRQTCTVCGSAAIFICSSCKAVWYCSQQCQNRHWTTHGKKCKNHTLNLEAQLNNRENMVLS